jgi:hypothetical protein
MASKRRAQLYTLPIVVGVGFLVGAGLAAWRRADLVAMLCDQIARGEKSQAAAAVRQLGVISNPPIPILVEAAACDDRATVEAAQVTINKLLDEWEQQVDNHRRLSRVAEQVSQLAGSLAAQRRTFPTSRYPWLASATHTMLRIADKCPPTTTSLLALHCDEIMAQVATASFTPAASILQPPVVAPTIQNGKSVSVADNSQDSDRLQLEQTFGMFPAVPTVVEPSAPHSTVNPRSNVAEEEVHFQTRQNPLRPESAPAPRDDAADSLNASAFSSVNQEPVDHRESVPAGNSLRPISNDTPTEIAAASGPDTPSSAAGNYSTRELLERWRTASGDEHRDIEHQLAARGFKRLSPGLVQQYLASGDGRAHVVDMVLKLPGPEVRPWLLLLGDDEDADVRLMAVTVMATSDDRALIEKAWQISIRDEDPRIADLSVHLRERRAGTQLR